MAAPAFYVHCLVPLYFYVSYPDLLSGYDTHLLSQVATNCSHSLRKHIIH